MKKLRLFLLLSIFAIQLSAQHPERFSRVKINLLQTHISEIGALGLEVDHGEIAKGRHLINDFSASEIALLDLNGIDYEILIDDVKAWYRAQNQLAQTQPADLRVNDCNSSTSFQFSTPDNYQYGSMGGYLTLAEALDEFDQMHAQYPQLISARTAIDPIRTHEGREIFWLRISDNPDQDEAEPEILYTALHHAREPNSLSQLVFYMWYLLENYATDPEVKYLIEQTELYFIPIVNPDGYYFNERTDPQGGGLWRKNRWVDTNSNDTLGVDLNRNYGYEWGFDDQGSSPNPNSQTFRGNTPFSEPETQAVRQFCNDHQFQIALNYHTYGNLLIYPWGYSDTPSPDSSTFFSFAEAMTRQNGFSAGTGSQTVGYTTNGDSDDWMYGEESSKPKIFSMTPEVGNQGGFWPSQSRIDDFNKNCMLQNLAAAHLLLNYVELSDEGEALLLSYNGSINLELKKYGLANGTLTVRLNPLSSNFQFSTGAEQQFSLEHLETAAVTADYIFQPSGNAIETMEFEVAIDNGFFIFRDTLTKTLINGTKETIAMDTAEDLSNWSAEATWGIDSSEYYSPAKSIGDSPSQDYLSNTNSSITLTTPVLIPEEALRATLNFRAKWEVEKNYDFVQIIAEVGSSGVVIPLCGKYTTAGSSNQAEGEPLYDGFSDWVLEEIDLSEYIGESLKFSFIFHADGFVEGAGFNFDDFGIDIIKANPVHSVELQEPANGLVVYPNPFANHLEVGFNLTRRVASAELVLVNNLGQEIARKNCQSLNVGKQQLEWALPALAPGIYTLRLDSGAGISLMQKLVKLR